MKYTSVKFVIRNVDIITYIYNTIFLTSNLGDLIKFLAEIIFSRRYRRGEEERERVLSMIRERLMK